MLHFVSVLIGDFDQQMEKFVKEHAIDLVIMGTECKNSLTELFAGSHAERTLRETDIPLLAIKKYNPSLHFNTILMALDIRDHDEKAVRRILQCTESLQMEIILVHVKRKMDSIEDNIEKVLNHFAEKYDLSHYRIEVVANRKVAQKLK